MSTSLICFAIHAAFLHQFAHALAVPRADVARLTLTGAPVEEQESDENPMLSLLWSPAFASAVGDTSSSGFASALRLRDIPRPSVPMLSVPVAFTILFIGLTLFSRVEWWTKVSGKEGRLNRWSMGGICALTAYRFHTGLMAATWMPYLLAMEGTSIADSRQSLFMGSAKLIYGASVLLNPMLGLFSDHVAASSSWKGRQLFILAGVGVSGVGIFTCMLSAQMNSLTWFFIGTLLWMIGEAVTDVTTETLVPMLLPRSQYEISGSIRSLSVLFGGLAGYFMIVVFRHWHFSWIYYLYLTTMIVCASVSLSVIPIEDQDQPQTSRLSGIGLADLATRAYFAPARLEGGFPYACLCLFIFSLGTAPIFFLLLMLRDIVGLPAGAQLQVHFALVSIAFFMSATAASVMCAMLSQRRSDAPPERDAAPASLSANAPHVEDEGTVRIRWRTMTMSLIGFGMMIGLMPMVGVSSSQDLRIKGFYIISSLCGLSFGVVYCKFMECTWSVLRQGVDIANAMGFAAMCKLAGLGFGSFFAGVILDYSATSKGKIGFHGYVGLHCCCACVAFATAWGTHHLGRMALDPLLTDRRAADPSA